MTLRYGIQSDVYLIGTSSTAATLTDTYTDNTKTFQVEGVSQAAFYIEYTPAAASRIVYIQYEFGPASDDFYKSTSKDTTSTARTLYIVPTQFTGTTASTAYKLRDTIDIADKWLRISVKESGSSSFGTVTIRGDFSG